MDASYCGGVHLDSVADVGLAAKGVTFYSFRDGCTMMWVVGGVLDMDAGTAAPDGGLHGWLSGEHHGGGDGLPSWPCGRREVVQRVARTHSLPLAVAVPRSGYGSSMLVVLALETSW